jgi:hypothetical protein
MLTKVATQNSEISELKIEQPPQTAVLNQLVNFFYQDDVTQVLFWLKEKVTQTTNCVMNYCSFCGLIKNRRSDVFL